MKIFLIFILLFSEICCSSAQQNNKAEQASVKKSSSGSIESVALPGVNGRIDHLAYNSEKKLLYVAALGNNTVEVVDLQNKRIIHTIKGLSEPQGILFIPGANIILTANGGDGECIVFNSVTYDKIASFKLEGDADNVRYNRKTGRIYVGYGDGGIAVVDAKTFKLIDEIRLPAHPESFQIDESADRIFVNVPDARLLCVVDLKSNKITEKWKIEEASSNFPMSIDTAEHRLFIGCRKPAKLLVINAETGKTIAVTDIDSDTDDIFYDNLSKRVYVSCGGGYTDIIKPTGIRDYEVISKIQTSPGARTSLYVEELKQLIVAAPSISGKQAALMILDVSLPERQKE